MWRLRPVRGYTPDSDFPGTGELKGVDHSFLDSQGCYGKAAIY